MPVEYNPRHFPRCVPALMLREYFEWKDLLADFPWDDFGTDGAESLYDAWMALPERARNEVSIDFQSATELASGEGIRTLLETGKARGVDITPALEEGRTNVQKVFSVLLKFPAVFRATLRYYSAQRLPRYWHRRNDLPTVVPNVGPAAILQLRTEISARYVREEARGEYCHIDVEPRGNVTCLYVYLADYPAAVPCFENSDELRHQAQQRAFDVVFIYDQFRGSLQLYAEGKCELRKELSQMFTRAVLGQEVDLALEPSPVFELNRLADPGFGFRVEPEDNVKSIQVQAMRCSIAGGDGKTLTFSSAPRSRTDGLLGFIEATLHPENVPLDRLEVEHATLHAVIGGRRPKSVTFYISANNKSNLKDTPENRGIRNCLKRSEIMCG